MSKAKQNPGSTDNMPGLDSSGNLDQIREILFGIQSREYDNKFSALESKMQSMQSDLMDVIEQKNLFLQKELKDKYTELKENIASNKKELMNSGKSLETEIADQMNNLNQTFNQQFSELQQNLSDNSHDSSRQITELKDKMMSQLDSLDTELSNRKLDKAKLADILADLSDKLV